MVYVKAPLLPFLKKIYKTGIYGKTLKIAQLLDHLALSGVDNSMLHIQVLSLPKKNLVEVPPAVWESADITTLDLTHNHITVLPTELSMCSALEVR